MPFPWELADANAIKALVRGDANSVQQQRAIDFIIRMARTYDLSYFPSDRDTAFAEGSRFVGLQIVKLININTSTLK